MSDGLLGRWFAGKQTRGYAQTEAVGHAKRRRNDDDFFMEPQQQQLRLLPPDAIHNLSQMQRVAESWVGCLGPVVKRFHDANQTLQLIKKRDAIHFGFTAAERKQLFSAKREVNDNFGDFKEIVSRNQRHLTGMSAASAQIAKELQEKNAALEAQLDAAENVAAETDTKLKKTEAALHASETGHANIASAFPLSPAIAQKLKGFADGDYSELIFDHLMPKCSSMTELSSALSVIFSLSSELIAGHGTKLEADVLDALQGLGRTKLVDGFLRQLWQEYHTHFFNVDGVDEEHIIAMLRYGDPVLAQLEPLEPATTDFLLRTVKQLLKLFVYIYASDPPLQLDVQQMGTEIAYDPATCKVLVDAMPRGKPAIVLLPALRTADGLLKVEAMVLPADYL